VIEQLAEYYHVNLNNTPQPDRDNMLLDRIYEIDPDFSGDEDKVLEEVKARTGHFGGQANRPPSQGQRPGGRRAAAPARRDRIAWQKAKHEPFVRAPFRFVPLGGRVALPNPDDDLTPLHRPVPGHLSATLDIEWAVETPLLIGEAESADVNAPAVPFSLGDDWAIPGASLRGMLRSALETVAFGRLWQTNRHARFGMRDFDHPHYRAFMQRLLDADGQKAGWLSKTKDGGYQIKPCDWQYIRIASLLDTGDRREFGHWTRQDRHGKYRKLGLTWRGKDAFRTPWTFVESGDHSHRGHHVVQRQQGGKPGCVVVSGAVPGKGGNTQKSFEYVFFDRSDAAVTITGDAWDVFETANCKPSQNKRMPDGAWKEFEPTVEAGGRVPVFYVGDPAKPEATDFSFGLTRLYRLPHRYSIGDILKRDSRLHDPAETKRHGGAIQPDFVEALFGYVHEDKVADVPPNNFARRGRIAVGFARAPKQGGGFTLWPETGPIATVMGPPKPSFAPFYLVGPEKDYSAHPKPASGGHEYPQLAGRKRYLPRRADGVEAGKAAEAMRDQLAAQLTALTQVSRNTDTSKVESQLRFLKPQSESAAFRGQIRLHNVSEAELGAVLWVLTFGGDAERYRHMLGRAKPFGAGQVYVRSMTVAVRPNDKEVDAQLIEWTARQGREGLADHLDAFETEIAGLANFNKANEWRASPPVQGFLKTSLPVGWDAPATHYLPYQLQGDGGQATRFQELRKAASSEDAPTGLLIMPEAKAVKG